MDLFRKLWAQIAPATAQQDELVPEALLNAMLVQLYTLGDPLSQAAAARIVGQRTTFVWDRRLTAAQIGLFERPVLLRALLAVAYQHSNSRTRFQAFAQLRAAASARELARPQLENLLAPSCGLGNEALFDYGKRPFQLVLGHKHTPLLREHNGRLHTSLPRPKPSDDAARVTHTREQWPWHKRELAVASRVHAARFEQAMATGLRWPSPEFAAMREHPLLGNLARRVLWAGYDTSGILKDVFCIVEDGSLASAHDHAVELERYATVGIPHPVTVAPKQRLRWAELLLDLEIMPLFPQANRPVYTITEDERPGETITRFQHIVLQRNKLCSALHRFGWLPDLQRRGFSYFWEDAGVVARLAIADEGARGRISRCWFEQWEPTGSQSPPEGAALGLREVAPAVISETLSQLSELTARPNLQDP